MRSRFSLCLFIRVFLCLAACLVAIPTSAQTPAYITLVEGDATLDRNGDVQPAVVNMPLVDGDRLRTANGRVDIGFPDGSRIEIDPYSEVVFVSTTRVRVLAGTIEHVAADPRSSSAQYLPPELRQYDGILDRGGAWQYQAPYGYVWYPAVWPGWRPYYDGYWSALPRYGWTWIGRDVWSWPTHHYGRWGYGHGAWYWIPEPTWGPAWVSWGAAPGYVSWCPLGFDNRPVFALVAGGLARSTGWIVVPQTVFSGRDLYVHRYAVEPHRLPSTTRFVNAVQPPVATPPRAVPRPVVAPGASAGVAVPRVTIPTVTTPTVAMPRVEMPPSASRRSAGTSSESPATIPRWPLATPRFPAASPGSQSPGAQPPIAAPQVERQPRVRRPDAGERPQTTVMVPAAPRAAAPPSSMRMSEGVAAPRSGEAQAAAPRPRASEERRGAPANPPSATDTRSPGRAHDPESRRPR